VSRICGWGSTADHTSERKRGVLLGVAGTIAGADVSGRSIFDGEREVDVGEIECD